jgi:hypothetical protein
LIDDNANAGSFEEHIPARRSAISYRFVEGLSLSGSLGATHSLANFETFELRVIQIQRLVVPCPTMRCSECL